MIDSVMAMIEMDDSFKSDVAALQFLVDAGLDVVIEPDSRNRFATPPAAPPTSRTTMPEPVAERPRTAASPRPARPQAIDSEQQAVARAHQVAPACNSLDELRAALEDFDGLSIRETANRLVFADGNPDADIMIIGEAPGRDEDRIGKPFVGQAGQLLDRMLAAIDLDRSSVYITNSVLWRPPGNRDPSATEAAAMLPFLIRHIELFQPKVMIVAGRIALNALFEGNRGITRERGTWRDYTMGEKVVPTLPIFHPAYLLRQPQLKREAWADLLDLRRKCQELGIVR